MTVLVLCVLIFCLLGIILIIIVSSLFHLNKRVVKVESQLIMLKARILSGVNLLGGNMNDIIFKFIKTDNYFSF